jgi:hypothetical protein
LFPLAAFGQALAIAIQARQQRQTPDLGWRPAAAHHQGEHHPIVAPAHHLERSAGEQGIVVHAGAVDGQAAFAAQGIVAGQFDEAQGGKGGEQQARQVIPQGIEAPASFAEEAVVTGVVAVVRRAAGQDQFGDETLPDRQAPAGEESLEGLETGLGENGGKLL